MRCTCFDRAGNRRVIAYRSYLHALKYNILQEVHPGTSEKARRVLSDSTKYLGVADSYHGLRRDLAHRVEQSDPTAALSVIGVASICTKQGLSLIHI